ncbi:DUF3168 domain-containing protein [Ochrobactrum soli]|nr:DUF3168 domain-containing protein [[Ochrobactrum] soli]
MTSPTYELQGAIVQRLKNDPALSAMIGGRVYDQGKRCFQATALRSCVAA